MTVKELIERLKTFPPDHRVVVVNEEWMMDCTREVISTTEMYETHDKYGGWTYELKANAKGQHRLLLSRKLRMLPKDAVKVVVL